MSPPSKWALDGIFLMNHEKVMPWSKYSWLFYCPKIVTFASWWFLSHALRNHDQELIKWCLWLQNNMLTKFFDFWLSNDHFAPAVDCGATRVFDGATWEILNLDLGKSWRIWEGKFWGTTKGQWYWDPLEPGYYY